MHWALAAVTLTLLAFAAVSDRIAGTPITAAMVFTAVGLLVGSEVLGLIDVAPAGEPVKLLAEATLALVLFAHAFESGLNDGICVPLFWIVLAIAQAESGAIGDSAAVRLVLEQIGYGILAGVLAGIAAACVVVVAGRHGHVAGSWLQVVPLAGAGLAFGVSTTFCMARSPRAHQTASWIVRACMISHFLGLTYQAQCPMRISNADPDADPARALCVRRDRARRTTNQ